MAPSMRVWEAAFSALVSCSAPPPSASLKPIMLLSTLTLARLSLLPNAVSFQPVPASTLTLSTLTAPKELLVMRISVAVVTVPSVPTAMGRMVGMVTFIFVAAGSPSRVPSEVEDRLTLEVPVPPETSTVVGSAADAPMARLAMRQTARSRDTSFFMFFIVSSPFSFC